MVVRGTPGVGRTTQRLDSDRDTITFGTSAARNGTWVNQQRIESRDDAEGEVTDPVDEFAYTFFEPERQIEGTIMRDFGKEITTRESVRPRQAPFRAGRDGHAGYRKRCRRSKSRCPSHPSFGRQSGANAAEGLVCLV